MAKRPLHEVTVHSVETLTPHMKRIRFTGPSLATFPEDSVGGYVKLLLDDRKRSYTIRAIDPDARILTVDCVLHTPAGPATAWMAATEPGTTATLAGPGPVQGLDPTADWVLLASDMTGLPALAAFLERLPAHMVGHAVVEVLHEDDRQRLAGPAGVAQTWLVNPQPSADRTPLADHVRAIPWAAGRPSVWAAAEFHTARALRQYLRVERGLGPDALYLSSYWKVGATDEEHKLAKRAEVAQ